MVKREKSKRSQQGDKMRDIKLRVWTGKEYRYPPSMNEWDIEDACMFIDYVNRHDSVLEQFTGLKDKNGKEIYEGDILSRESFTPWVVTFEKGSFCIANITFQCRLFSCFDVDVTDREIIGNIHENPELMTNTEKVL